MRRGNLFSVHSNSRFISEYGSSIETTTKQKKYKKIVTTLQCSQATKVHILVAENISTDRAGCGVLANTRCRSRPAARHRAGRDGGRAGAAAGASVPGGVQCTKVSHHERGGTCVFFGANQINPLIPSSFTFMLKLSDFISCCKFRLRFHEGLPVAIFRTNFPLKISRCCFRL